jgi:aspartate racemase
MATLGIIGGIGPESTVEYYRAIIAAYAERFGPGTSPSVVINSIDVNRLLAMMGTGDREGVADYLVVEIGRLARAGAGAGLIAANTPHIVFDQVQARSPIPLISIVDATCAAVQRAGFTRAGLLGTRFTMAGQFYQDTFGAAGIALVVPAGDEQLYIHDKYTTELLCNVFLPETRAGLMQIVERMKERDRIDAVILGGTELPLILRESEAAGVPLFDTTRIHAHAAVDRLWP